MKKVMKRASWVLGFKKPGTRMPAWKGVIKEEDYDPLMAYVRTLSKSDGRSAAR